MMHYCVLVASESIDQIDYIMAPYDESLRAELAGEPGETYWHNPNGKWDWFVVGGRWSGLLSDYDPEHDIDNYDKCWLCHGTGIRNDALGRRARQENPAYGCNGCNGSGWLRNHHNKPFSGDTQTVQRVKQIWTPKLIPFAFIDIEGRWHERQTWHWNKKTQNGEYTEDENWGNFRERFIEPLPGHMLITVVDIHN